MIRSFADKLTEALAKGERVKKWLGVPQNRISDIVRGRRGISADMALRLEKAFGVSAQFWLSLQQQHDLIQAHIAAGDQIDRIEPIAA